MQVDLCFLLYCVPLIERALAFYGIISPPSKVTVFVCQAWHKDELNAFVMRVIVSTIEL